MARLRFFAGVVLLISFTAGLLEAADAKRKKKKKEDEEPVTQVLPQPKDPPAAVVAEVQRLGFYVSPLSAKGLLSQQTRDALKSLQSQSKGAPIIRLRAFVAGSGDLRRVQTIVSEVYTEKKLNPPAMVTVQVGALPLEGAQILMEAITQERRPVHPNGLALISGQPAKMGNALEPLRQIVGSAGLDAGAAPRVTCFLSSLEGVEQLRTATAQAFPKAALTLVKLLRGPQEDFAECEAVVSLPAPPGAAVTFDSPMEGRYSQIARLAPGKIALSGLQLCFHSQEADVRLAFYRLGKTLEGVQTNLKNVVFNSIYPLSRSATEQVRKIRFDYYDGKRPPASTMVVFEGLPSLDATFGIDVVAVVP